MHDDTKAIRELIAAWQDATAGADLPRLTALLDENVVFLVSGQPALVGRSAFTTAFAALAREHDVRSHAKIEEIVVAGDLAYSWTHLTVTVSAKDGAPVRGTRRAGHALTVLRKKSDGAWVIFRDANMLAAELEPAIGARTH
jgi:uncharacterized protein (TIGR02246 family)